MLLNKLRLTVGTVMVLVVLGAVGFGYQAAVGSGAAQAAPPDKPVSELEALRKENELLKLNLQVVLEKVRAQETDLQGLRKELAALKPNAKNVFNGTLADFDNDGFLDVFVAGSKLYLNKSDGTIQRWHVSQDDTADPVKEAESAVKALREAKDKDTQRKAIGALDKAMKKLREQVK